MGERIGWIVRAWNAGSDGQHVRKFSLTEAPLADLEVARLNASRRYGVVTLCSIRKPG